MAGAGGYGAEHAPANIGFTNADGVKYENGAPPKGVSPVHDAHIGYGFLTLTVKATKLKITYTLAQDNHRQPLKPSKCRSNSAAIGLMLCLVSPRIAAAASSGAPTTCRSAPLGRVSCAVGYCVKTRMKPCFAPPKTDKGTLMVFKVPSPATLEFVSHVPADTFVR